MASFDQFWSFPKDQRIQMPKKGEPVITEVIDDEEDEDEADAGE